MRNLSYENEFDLHRNEPVGGTHFHMNGLSQTCFDTEAKADSKIFLFSSYISLSMCIILLRNPLTTQLPWLINVFLFVDLF